jgi:hypothetical protein
MGFYSRHIAPGLVDFACSAKPIAYQRRKIIPQASGVVLEIGAGGGRNFALYDRTKVSHLIALEPEAGMIKRGRARVPDGLAVEWLERGAETAGLAPNSLDTIVTTYTLCTIPDACAGARRSSSCAQTRRQAALLRTRPRARCRKRSNGKSASNPSGDPSRAAATSRAMSMRCSPASGWRVDHGGADVPSRHAALGRIQCLGLGPRGLTDPNGAHPSGACFLTACKFGSMAP